MKRLMQSGTLFLSRLLLLFPVAEAGENNQPPSPAEEALNQATELRTDLVEFIFDKLFQEFLLSFAGGVFALAFVIGGIQYMLDPKRGKTTLVWSGTGLIITLLAVVIINFVTQITK